MPNGRPHTRAPRIWRGGTYIESRRVFVVGTVTGDRVTIDCVTPDCLRPYLGELTEAEERCAAGRLLDAARRDAARLDELRPRRRSA
jgi:hypothetical protein